VVLREQQALEEALRGLNPREGLTQQAWELLRGVFGERFEKAWDLVRQGRVKKYVFQPSGRVLWVVVGQEAEYLVYRYAGYCSCSDFYFRVLNQETAYCYHLLAQRLAESLEAYQTVKEEDRVYPALMEEWKRVFAG